MTSRAGAQPVLAAAALAAAFAWGVAEAVWLFVVADVLLSFIALRLGLRTALAASLAAALGAACGGFWLASMAAADPARAFALLASVPFVTPGLVEHGLAVMASPSWPLGMLAGSVTGLPYKIFAVGAGEQAIAPVLFSFVSLAVRLPRFALASAATALAARLIGSRLGDRGKLALLAAFWIIFYGQFWLRMTMKG